MTNYYQILGVSVHATQGEIKFAHRQLIKKFHPDLTKQPHNLTMINLVNEAYQILSNQESRSLYDQKYFFTPNQRELSSVFNEDWVNFQTGKNDRNLNPEQYHPEEEISSDHQQTKGLNKENQSIYQDDNLKENILSSQKTGD